MNAVIDAIVADLETKRSELDRAITALRGLNGDGKVTVAMLPGPAKKQREPKGDPPAEAKESRKNGILTPEQMAESKRLWIEGSMTASEIGTRVGKSTAWAHVTAKANCWPARKPQKAGKPTASTGPERRCENCGQRTRANPCDHCFEKA
jgi:hypothetical protein